MSRLKDRLKLVFRNKTNGDTCASSWDSIIGKELKGWQNALSLGKSGPKVLIATSTGGHPWATAVESLLGVALTLRGASVHFLLCDQFLPACLESNRSGFGDTEEFVLHGPQKSYCTRCFQEGTRLYRPLGLPIHLYSELVSDDELEQAKVLAESVPAEQIPHYRIRGLAVGEHALAGALRYFARGSLTDEPFGEDILRRYFHASILTTYALQRLLSESQFEVACFHHGLYVPQGIIGEVARRQNVRVVNWIMSYRKQTFIFSHGDTYHHTLMSEPVGEWEDIPWNDELETILLDYLRSRWNGTMDWIRFTDRSEANFDIISSELRVDRNKPMIGLLTNVVWDAQLHYPANAFPNMLDWLIRTIQYFSERQDLQLVVRVHPAEVKGAHPSRQPVISEIRKAFPFLPPNVFIIPPESEISTYAMMEHCDSVIIYGTKTGVELASMGIPVIVAGEAWVRNKGITIDAQSPKEYFEILSKLPLNRRMDEESVRRARKYAFHFFFRRMIPLHCLEQSVGHTPLRLVGNSLDDFLPGKDLGLDTICNGILSNSPFIYPAEKNPAIDIRTSLRGNVAKTIVH